MTIPKDCELLQCAISGIPVEFRTEASTYGDMFTIEEFMECVKCGAFIDSDGFGQFSDGVYVSYEAPHDDWFLGGWNFMAPSHCPVMTWDVVMPSRMKRGTIDIPAWATHVLWFNK